MTTDHGLAFPAAHGAMAMLYACLVLLLQGCSREQLCKVTISSALTAADKHVEELIDAGCDKAVHGHKKCYDFAKDVADCFHLEKAAIEATIITECVLFKGSSGDVNATVGESIYGWIASQSQEGAPLHDLYEKIIDECMSNHSMSASKAAAEASAALSEPTGAIDSNASAGVATASDVSDAVARLFEEHAIAEAARQLSIAGYMACLPIVVIAGFAMVVLRVGLHYAASGASRRADDPEDLRHLVVSESEDSDE
jgi:hypothetical protein